MDAALHQIERLAERRGERSACMEARHQLPWYLHGVPYSGSYRQQMVHVETLAEIRTIVSRIKRVPGSNGNFLNESLTKRNIFPKLALEPDFLL